MGDLSKNFSRHEFECKCGCGYDTVDAELLVVVQDVRDYFGVPVTFNSACRCEKHNKAEGGSKNSQHLYGKACDIVVKDVDPKEVYEYLIKKYYNKYGISLYDTFVHIDVRGYRARW